MYKPYRWVFCQICDCWAVLCPDCNNNLCNGSHGDNCMNRCEMAYSYYYHNDKIHTFATREEQIEFIKSLGDIVIEQNIEWPF